MKSSTEAPVRDASATRSREVWRRLWLSWWDGIWLWIAAGLVGAIILAPWYLLHLVLPQPSSRVVGAALFVLFVLISPVAASRVFRALDNTRPWERKRP